jgi:chorismate mutase
MPVRGVRGATTVEHNGAAEIGNRTLELLRVLVEQNGLRPEDLASATFTVTDDLDAAFPAQRVRETPGWEDVPLLCAREIPVPGALGMCIRVLLHWNTERAAPRIRHAYLRGARALRPAWAVRVPGDDDAGTPPEPGSR